MTITRRGFLGASAVTLLSAARPQEPGERPKRPEGVTVLNPRARVPVGLIVDDSTCLVNLAHFAIPQFQAVFPDRFKQPWRTLPREIPNAFVRKFAAWSRENGVRGKFSVVPYPACVGWVDREMPGWPKSELEESLKILREDLAPHWDFNPEMVSHTWVINPKDGRPHPERSERFMENWGWSRDRSADEMGAYLAYALRALKNAGIVCEGVTSPGGFGTGALAAYARGVLESCRDVFQVEVPHYVKHAGGDPSVAPRVHYASGLDGADPRCVVQIVAGTGDWFGGWDGLVPGSVDKFITADGRSGRMVEVIRRGEPALMLGHWPGFYCNGEESGFTILKEIVRRLSQTFDHLVWMKLSEVARYWAARELTRIERAGNEVKFAAPFACPAFTVEVAAGPTGRPALHREVARPIDLQSGTWCRSEKGFLACFDLPKGASRLEILV